jgi:site-specific DNA-methyltransferase (adenine-specific)
MIRSAKKIHNVSVRDIKPYENNARINDHVVYFLKESIVKFGFNSPIVLDENNIIICGHTRLKAASELGLTHVPCVYAEGLTEKEIAAYRLADNKIAEKALWDMAKLDAELASIGTSIDMESLGFKDDITPSVEPDVVIQEPAEPEPNNAPRLHRCPHCGEVFED